MAAVSKQNTRIEPYRRLYENSRDILLFVRLRDGKILEANPAAVKAYGYTRGELLARTIFALRAPGALSEIAPQMTAADSAEILFETVHRRKDGTLFPVEVHSQRSTIGNEEVLLSLVRDITDRRRAEELLGKERQELETILDAAPVMIFYKDRENRIIRVNRARAEAAGLPKEALEGKNAFDIFPEQAESYWRDDREVMASGKPKRGIIETIETPRGPRWVRTDKIPYRNEAGAVIGVIGFSVDITELKQLEQELREMALRDQLTELYNRRGFITLGEQQIRTAKRTQKSLLLSYIDVDGMKRVNDTLGHEEGDHVLIHTAQILRQTFRESDIIARIGGDEFAVLSLDVTDMNPETCSMRLRNHIDSFNAAGGRPYKIDLSWDTAVYDPKSPESLDQLLAAADQMMYRRKRDKSIP